MDKDNKIFVGNKPFMNYVTGVIMQFTTKEADEVIVKSRGKYISRAVDVVEVAANNFLKDQIEVGAVKIGSETFTNNQEKEVRVSTIDITLVRKK